MFLNGSPPLVSGRLESGAAHFVDRLPKTHNTAEHLLQRALLLDLAVHLGNAAHDAFHHHDSEGSNALRRCEFEPTTTLDEWLADLARSPGEAFRRWATRYVMVFHDVHMLECARRAQAYIQIHFRDRIALPNLARELRCASKHLRRSFKDLTGLSVREYQAELRFREALRLLEHTDLKIEAIAREVGHNSKKGLYRVVQQRVGRTPLDFRKHCRSGRWLAPIPGDGMVSSF
jgi:AraC-like DNA-binding protein